MAEIVRMPKLSDTMTEGVVAEWHKNVGDHVEAGDLLAEIETDKATMEFESFQEGTLLHIGIKKGETASVDAILAILGNKGEDVSELLKAEAAAPAPAPETPSAHEKTPAPGPAPTSASVAAVKPAENPVPVPVTDTDDRDSGSRLKVSPLARRLAQEKGIALAAVSGSGDGGRIVKKDIENYAPAPTGTAYATPVGTEAYTEENVSQMRKTIARRLSESKFSAPHFYLTMEIDMDNAITARKTINAHGEVKVSFNDLVVKATAMALRQHPKVNSSWLGNTIRRNQHINIGIAVAVDEGLLVPVIPFTDNLTISQINAQVKELAGKARNKKLQPSEWEGNTFTISNLGMFGIEEFTAIINPPDACILAVGGIKQTPVVKNGEVVPGNVMKVTLSCDHRVVDGATGSAFLKTLKAMLEDPVMMLA